MRVTRGLVIDGHWVSLILAGRKTWEMRSQATNLRGTIGLIRKGAGQVWGVADLVDCGTALTEEQMLNSIERHQIPESMILSGEVGAWRIPWVLERAISFDHPVPYDHPNGAVKWVHLNESVSEQISERLKTGGRIAFQSETVRATQPKLVQVPATPLSQILAPVPAQEVSGVRSSSPILDAGRVVGRTVITEGNIKNNHLYLRGFFDSFPEDSVGGSNRNQPAKALLKVRWRGSDWHETDLDGKKLFFRSRSLVRKFFDETGAKAGDSVDVERVDTFHYVLHLRGGRDLTC